MKKFTMALAVAALLASSAMASVFPKEPALTSSGGTFTYPTTEVTTSGDSGSSWTTTWFDPDPSYDNDYVLSTKVDFDTNAMSELGLLARADAVTSSCYELSINPNNRFVVLLPIFEGEVRRDLMKLYSIPNDKWSLDHDYQMRLKVEGNVLTGYVYNPDGTLMEDAGCGYTVQLTDSTLTNGKVGLFTFQAEGATGCAGHFINHDISAVPEPSSLALLGIGAISLLVYAWRCRKQA